MDDFVALGMTALMLLSEGWKIFFSILMIIFELMIIKINRSTY